MKRLTLLAFLLLLGGGRAFGQNQTVTGNLIAASSSCNTVVTTSSPNCIVINLPNAAGAVSVTLSGTFSATVQFEAAGADLVYHALLMNPSSSSTQASSATAAGLWTINVAGMTAVRVRCSAYTSGTVVATINPSLTASMSGAGGGGGGMYADQALDNLTSPTAINQDLTPDTAGGRNLGTAAVPWGIIYAQTFDFPGPVIIGSASTSSCSAPSAPLVSALCSTGPNSIAQVFDPVGMAYSDVVAVAIAQTLASKTLTSPTINGAAIGGAFTGTGAYIPVSLLNSGTSASSTTFWRGDGAWGTPAVSTVNGVSFSGAASAGMMPYTTAASTSLWSVTPILGLSGTAGTLSMFPASGNFTTTWGSAATASNTILGFATVPTTNTLPKCVSATTVCTLTQSSITDNGTTATTTDTGGYVAPVFVANGTTAGFADYPQGTTSGAVAPCNTATSICVQAPTSVTSYLENLPAAAPDIASYAQTDGCGSAICTESFHPVPVMMEVTPSDYTDSTSGSLQLITGLSTTMPVSKATIASFHCMLLFDQGSTAVVDQFGVGVTGTAPNHVDASGIVWSNASHAWTATGTLTALASTTPTLIVSFTPSAITTIWNAEIDGTVDQPSNATPGVLGIYAYTTTGTDNLIVKRGSFCSVTYQ